MVGKEIMWLFNKQHGCSRNNMAEKKCDSLINGKILHMRPFKFPGEKIYKNFLILT